MSDGNTVEFKFLKAKIDAVYQCTAIWVPTWENNGLSSGCYVIYLKDSSLENLQSLFELIFANV